MGSWCAAGCALYKKCWDARHAVAVITLTSSGVSSVRFWKLKRPNAGSVPMVTQDRRAPLVGHARSFWPTLLREIASGRSGTMPSCGRATRGLARKDCVTFRMTR